MGEGFWEEGGKRREGTKARERRRGRERQGEGGRSGEIMKEEAERTGSPRSRRGRGGSCSILAVTGQER